MRIASEELRKKINLSFLSKGLDHSLAYSLATLLSFQNKLVILKRDSTIKCKVVKTSYLRTKEEVIMAKYVSVKLPDAWMSF